MQCNIKKCQKKKTNKRKTYSSYCPCPGIYLTHPCIIWSPLACIGHSSIVNTERSQKKNVPVINIIALIDHTRQAWLQTDGYIRTACKILAQITLLHAWAKSQLINSKYSRTAKCAPTNGLQLTVSHQLYLYSLMFAEARTYLIVQGPVQRY